MRGLHSFLFNKWYFDELYDVLFVRPVRALGEASSNFFERNVIQGIVGGTALAVRAGKHFLNIGAKPFQRGELVAAQFKCDWAFRIGSKRQAWGAEKRRLFL